MASPDAAAPPRARPLYKLSVQLIDTYKLINQVYYDKKKARKRAQKHAEWDDENYDYIARSGETFNEKYIVKERIGKGSFGQVVRAWNTEQSCEVAIKIIKSKRPFLLQARTEIELLSQLRDLDPNDQHNIVRMFDHFVYRNHQCLVFEILSCNLYELLKNTQFHGVSLNLIRKFARQILRALAFLAAPSVDIIHCDLKPENILLRHPKRSAIKVIDFGSSCHANQRMYSYIQSRFYRSPEVMLGLSYGCAIDMWSLGCILVEMHTGEPLFSGADQSDQMRKLVDVLGMPSDELILQAERGYRDQYFQQVQDHDDGAPEWRLCQRAGTEDDAAAAAAASPARGISDILGVESGGPGGRHLGDAGHSPLHYEMFVDFVKQMLQYSPQDRMRPVDALHHAFLDDAVWQAQGAAPAAAAAVGARDAETQT